MKIASVTTLTNNYQNAPNFGKIEAIKIPKKAIFSGVKSENLFNINKAWAISVLKTMQENPKLMEFLNKYPITELKLMTGNGYHTNPLGAWLPIDMAYSKQVLSNKVASLRAKYIVKEAGRKTKHTIEIRSELKPTMGKDIAKWENGKNMEATSEIVPFNFDYIDAKYDFATALLPKEALTVSHLQKEILNGDNLRSQLQKAENYISKHATDEYKHQAEKNLTEYLSQKKDPDLALSYKEIEERLNKCKGHKIQGPEWWRNMSAVEREAWDKKASKNEKIALLDEFKNEEWQKYPEDMEFMAKIYGGGSSEQRLEKLKNKLMLKQEVPENNTTDIGIKHKIRNLLSRLRH